MENSDAAAVGLLIDRLKILEYEIRKSITVREDQEDNALPQHRNEAERCEIAVENLYTKEELLNAVQTKVRGMQKLGKLETGNNG